MRRIHLNGPFPYRACQLCDHGRASAGKTCAHPDAPRGNLIHELRDPGGACGPEANWLDYTGLNPPVNHQTGSQPLSWPEPTRAEA